MNFQQIYDLKNGKKKCNLCDRYMKKGLTTIETNEFIITLCLRCRKTLEHCLKIRRQ